MALILNIDTATENASLALSKNGEVLQIISNPDLKDHAAWIHTAIKALMDKSGHALSQLNAIAVTAGPGSYTGLRVGMATAKGLCYVLNIPMITENTLKVMAKAAKDLVKESSSNLTKDHQLLLVPMIDARRMEVFTAVYDSMLKEVMDPIALVLSQDSFSDKESGNELIIFGSGSAKFQQLIQKKNFHFENIVHNAGHLAALSYEKFLKSDFANLAYVEPVYLKEFYTHTKK